MLPGTEPNRFFCPNRGNGLQYTRTRGQLGMSPYNGNIPTPRLFLCPAYLYPQAFNTFIPFLFTTLNSFLLLTSRNPNQKFKQLHPDFSSALLEDRLWAWCISLSPNSHTEPQYLEHSWEMLVEPDLCYVLHEQNSWLHDEAPSMGLQEAPW